MITNPLSEGIRHVAAQFDELEWGGSRFLPALFVAIVLVVTLLLLVVLWPYGLLAIVEDMLRQLMRETIENIRGESLAVTMGYTIAIGFFFVVWLPFAVLCLPFYALGALGRLLLTGR